MGKKKSKFGKKLQNQLIIRSLRATKWSIGHLPRGFVLFSIEGLFSIAGLFTTKLNQICERNLKSVYGSLKTNSEYVAMRKQCIKNIGRTMMDLLYFVKRPQKLSNITSITGEEHLKAALDKGKGVIAVTAHLGNFPLLFVSLSQKGYKVNVIIRRMRSESFSTFMYDLCAPWKINMIQLKPQKNFFKESLGCLRRNELLFILFDEMAPEGEGVRVDFLSQKVRRAIGPMLFQRRTDAAVMPIFISQNENKNFNIHIENELEVEKDKDQSNNDLKNISNLTNTIESFVKQYPQQWGGWLNKRWVQD